MFLFSARRKKLNGPQSLQTSSSDICQIPGPDFEESPTLATGRGLEPATARLTIQPPAPLNPPLKGYKVEVGFSSMILKDTIIEHQSNIICYNLIPNISETKSDTIKKRNVTQVLQAEVKRKKSPCYAPKRKVILDEYPDEVSPYYHVVSSSHHLIMALWKSNFDECKLIRETTIWYRRENYATVSQFWPKTQVLSSSSTSAVFCHLPRCQNATLEFSDVQHDH